MTTEDLVKHCRYYKGQEKCPSSTDSLFWNYERIWVEYTLKAEDENTFEAQELKALLKLYKDAHLENFQEDDGVPITLKAFLLNRYEHWTDSSDGFEEWYLKKYKRE